MMAANHGWSAVWHLPLVLLFSAACSSQANSVAVASTPACSSDPAIVRQELERAYQANGAGFLAGDPDAVMRLRHPHYHTVDHLGQLSTRQQMSDRTAMLISRVVKWDKLSEEILSLEVHGDTAIVVVRQQTVRTQNDAQGNPRNLDTKVTQREWWRCTPEGWRMWRVDDIRDRETRVNGVLQQ